MRRSPRPAGQHPCSCPHDGVHGLSAPYHTPWDTHTLKHCQVLKGAQTLWRCAGARDLLASTPAAAPMMAPAMAPMMMAAPAPAPEMSMADMAAPAPAPVPVPTQTPAPAGVTRPILAREGDRLLANLSCFICQPPLSARLRCLSCDETLLVSAWRAAQGIAFSPCPLSGSELSDFVRSPWSP